MCCYTQIYTFCSSEYSWWAVSSWAPRQVFASVWSSLKSAWERSETRSSNVGRDDVSGCLWMRLIRLHVCIIVIFSLISPALYHHFIYWSRTTRRRRKTISWFHKTYALHNIILQTQNIINILQGLPLDCSFLQMVYVPNSISHTVQLQNSTHHLKLNTSWSLGPG